MDTNAGYMAVIALTVVGNIVYNWLKDSNNHKVTIQMMEMMIHIKNVRENQQQTLDCLHNLNTEAAKQTSLLEQLVKRDS